MTKLPLKITETDIAILAGTVTAPESLHRRVHEMVQDAQRHPPARHRIGWAISGRRHAVALAGAFAAIVAVVVAVALSGGSGFSSLTPRAAAALALAPATMPGPSESHSKRGELTASVGGVAFPYWEERFGWRSSGARGDTLGGHAVTTVFYSNAHGQRVGYAIAAGSAPTDGGGTTISRWGVSYRLSTLSGANVIVWHRQGHLCVIAGRGVSAETLLSLASWGTEAHRA